MATYRLTPAGSIRMELMNSDRKVTDPSTPRLPRIDKLVEQYGSGSSQFTGTGNGLYERHLMFDNVVGSCDLGCAGTLRGCRTLGTRHPCAAVADHVNDPADHPPIINTRQAAGSTVASSDAPHRAILSPLSHAGSRLSLARMEAGDAVQTKGFGSALCSAR
jgi:hypothetical protein